ncbi:MFS transporter (acetyl-CoA transporter) [Sarotherodon galilaeus]
MSDSAEARACFMKWKYSRHFTFLKQADKNITVICKLCPGEKKLSAAVNSTSNLLKHLTRQHRQSLLSEPSSSSMDNTAATPAKQTKLDFTSATQKVSATSKCSAMWTKANRSSVAKEITDIPLAELNTVCTQFGIKCFTDREYLFLKEYCIVLKPLTVALDILQGEENCYFGILLPTLEILMSRTLALQDELKLTASLPDIIVKAIKVRFSSMMDNKEALLAAVTLPKFKLRWIREEEKKDMVRAMLTTECRGLTLLTPLMTSFEEDDCTYSAETEVMEYLKSAGSELGVLSQFPRIKAISLRYNTATPSSAPVERLFSLGNLVLTPRRNRLSSERFERLTLMRYNNYFKNNTAKYSTKNVLENMSAYSMQEIWCSLV